MYNKFSSIILNTYLFILYIILPLALIKLLYLDLSIKFFSILIIYIIYYSIINFIFYIIDKHNNIKFKDFDTNYISSLSYKTFFNNFFNNFKMIYHILIYIFNKIRLK